MDQHSAVVVLSGGQDSTTCLLLALKKYTNVKAITFSYGQRHIGGVQVSKEICKDLGVEQKVITLDFMNEITKSALLNTNEKISQADNDHFPNAFVPGRNLIFLSLAAIYAYSLGYYHVITGVCQTDFSGYPDCRDTFVRSLNTTVNLAIDTNLSIDTPLMWKDKSQTWEIADRLGKLDYIRENTLTCYEGVKGDGCGKCPACVLRQQGLKKYINRRGGNNEN